MMMNHMNQIIVQREAVREITVETRMETIVSLGVIRQIQTPDGNTVMYRNVVCFYDITTLFSYKDNKEIVQGQTTITCINSQ